MSTRGALGAPAGVFCQGLVVLPDRVSGVYVFGYLVMCGGGTVGRKEPGWPCSVPAEGARRGPLRCAVCGPASPAPASGCPWDMRHGGSGSIWKVRAGAGGGGFTQSYQLGGWQCPSVASVLPAPLSGSLSPRVGRALSLSLSLFQTLHLSLSLSLCLLHPPPSLFLSPHLPLSVFTRTHARTHTLLSPGDTSGLHMRLFCVSS